MSNTTTPMNDKDNNPTTNARLDASATGPQENETLATAFAQVVETMDCPLGVQNAAESVREPPSPRLKRRTRNAATTATTAAGDEGEGEGAAASHGTRANAEANALRFLWASLTGMELAKPALEGLIARGVRAESLTAAKDRIIAWWRRTTQNRMTTRLVVEDFLKHGICLKTAAEIPFDALALRLREPELIKAARRAAERVFYIAFGRRSIRGVASPNINSRVFVAAYMIVCRPGFVFESRGPNENNLITAAVPLLEVFHTTCEAVAAAQDPRAVPTELMRDFPEILHDYVRKFKTWKIPDEQKLAQRIKHALEALYAAERRIDAEADENAGLLAGIKKQQTRLRYKLLQVAGEHVLRAFDAENSRTHLPMPTAAEVADEAGAAGAAEHQPGGMYASIPGRMSNEQLAHELLLDPNFRLDDNGGSPASENPHFATIRQTFHDAFWASLVSDLRLPTPCYVRVVRVLEEVHEGMKDLCNGSSSLQADAAAAISIGEVRAAVERGTLEWGTTKAIFDPIVALIQRMQAPKRDAQTRDGWRAAADRLAAADAAPEARPEAFCAALEFVLDRVNIVRIDAANSRLRMIAPVITIHGVGYERAHFEKRLKAGTETLARTKTWIAGVLRDELAAARVDRARLESGDPAEYTAVHAAAVAALITPGQDTRFERETSCPETIRLDYLRIRAARNEVRFQQFAATTLTLVANCGPCSSVAEHAADFFRNYTLTNVPTEEAFTAALNASAEANGALTEQQRRALAKAASDAVNPANPVRRIFYGADKRIALAWREAITQNAREPDQPPMQEIVARAIARRIEDGANAVRKFTALNISIHASRYNTAITEALEEQQ